MTQSITPRNGTADIAAAVPTQRIVTSEAVAANRVRDRRGRFIRPGGSEATQDLPGGAISDDGRSQVRRQPARQPEAGQPEAGQPEARQPVTRQPVTRQVATAGRSRAADRAERAARARAERAAARERAESEIVDRTTRERTAAPRTTGQRTNAEGRITGASSTAGTTAAGRTNAGTTNAGTTSAGTTNAGTTNAGTTNGRVRRGRTAAGRTTAGHARADRGAADRGAADRTAADRGAADRTAADRADHARTDDPLPEQADPMEDRAKAFRVAVSELASDRKGGPVAGHRGPLVRARAARSEAPADRSRPERARPSAERQGSSRPSRPDTASEMGREIGSGIGGPAIGSEARDGAGPEFAEYQQAPRVEVGDGWTAFRSDIPQERQVHVRTPLSDLVFDRLERTTELPDLTAALGAIPGGLGAEVGESFVFAGQEWTSVDAHATGTPIGLQLAMEQRGLGVSDPGYLGVGAGRRRASV